MKLYCIADEDTVRGLRLAGVAGEVVDSPAQAAAALDHAAGDPDIGLVILTQGTAAGIREHLERLRNEREFPLIVEIAGPSGRAAGQKSLRQLVQEAVGISVGPEEGA